MLKLSVALFILMAAFTTAATAQSSQQSAQINITQERSGDVQASVFERRRVVNSAENSISAAVSAAERQAFDLINKQRADAGFEALVWNNELAAVARQHSSNMAEYKFFSHRGLDGSTVDERADKLGVRDWQAIGENIAFVGGGYGDPVEFVVLKWMQSTSHRQNLLDKRWKESGIGVAILPDGTYYLTQVFLLRN